MSDELDPQDTLAEGDPTLSGAPSGAEVTETPPGGRAAEPTTSDLSKAMAELASTVNRAVAPRPAPAKQLTQAEMDEKWAIYHPERKNPDFYKKLLRLGPDVDPVEAKCMIDERMGLDREYRDGMIRQAVIGAQNLAEEKYKELRSEMEPLLQFYRDAQAKETKAGFEKAYPSLADPKFAKIVTAAASMQSGKTHASLTDFFKAVAETAADSIKGVLPEFDLGAKPTPKNPGTSPRLPRTSVGGSGGAGGGNSGAVGKPLGDSDSIF